MTLIEERYELVKERLQDMLTEQAVSEEIYRVFSSDGRIWTAGDAKF